jgi:hypothetical protein
MKERSWSVLLWLFLLCTAIIVGCGGSGGGGGPVPAAPASVSANPGNVQVTVTWSPSPGAASYNIYYYYYSSGTVKSAVTKVSNAVSPEIIAGLTNNTTYYFVVTAVNANGESAGSAVKVATPIFNPPPDVPQTIQATAGDRIATISWDSVLGATSYAIYYRNAQGVSKTNGTRVPNVTSPATVTGFTNNTTYYFVVTASNAYAESAESLEVSATPVAPVGPLPAAPTSVQASPGNGQASISWTAIAGATSYNIYYATATGVTKTNGTRIPNATSPAVVTSLTNGTTYYFVVTAVNANGESVESAEVSARPATVANSLRVRVVNAYDANRPISGARVVLGDGTGALVSNATTASDGTATFTYPPANATVTVAVKTSAQVPAAYSLKTLYDVNVIAVTIDLNLQVSEGSMATVTVNNSITASSWDIFPGYVTGDATSNPSLVSLFTSDIQNDGKVSFVTIGHDVSGNVIGYGTLLDQTIASPMSVTASLDKTDIGSAGVFINHIPASAANGSAAAYLTAYRKGGSGYVTTAQSVISSPSPTTLTLSVPAVPGFGDGFSYQGEIRLGTTNEYYRFLKKTGTLGNQTFDLSTYPGIPANLLFSTAVPARPIFSWTGSDVSANSIAGALQYSNASVSYDYAFEAPTSRTSAVFPELPVAMAEYAPTWVTGFTIENTGNNLATGYDATLTAFDEYLGGTLTPAVFFQWRSGNGI